MLTHALSDGGRFGSSGGPETHWPMLLKSVDCVSRLAEAWVTEPSLESCESPELRMKEGSGGLLMAKKGEWKLVRPTLSHPPAGPSWPQGAVSLVWRRDSWERHRQQPLLSSM